LYGHSDTLSAGDMMENGYRAKYTNNKARRKYIIVSFFIAKYTNNKARRKYIIVSFFIEQARLKKWVATLILSIILLFATVTGKSNAARIKDLAYINGVRSNQLVGYGLVVGLNGTGDKSNTIFTNQSLANMLEKMGVRIDPKLTKVNNIAAVTVTADLPPFGKVGNKIDATVSSIHLEK